MRATNSSIIGSSRRSRNECSADTASSSGKKLGDTRTGESFIRTPSVSFYATGRRRVDLNT